MYDEDINVEMNILCIFSCFFFMVIFVAWLLQQFSKYVLHVSRNISECKTNTTYINCKFNIR